MTINDLRVLVENLDEYIHIPGGIDRLKKTVLHLAVSGQLVAQDPSEGTGKDLSMKLKAENISKKKPTVPADSEKPFDIPSNWKWVRLADIGQITGGGTPSSGNMDYYTDDHKNGIAWLTPADLRGYKKLLISHGAKSITEAGLKNSSARLMPAGTVLFSSRAPIGHIAIADGELSTNQGFKSIVPYGDMSSEYIYRWLQYYAPTIDANASGTTFREVSGAIVSEQPIPLPPLAEQNRITQRVNEVFTLIDELDTKYQAEDAERSRFVKSSLRALSHSGSRLALENLTSSIKTKADAAELRKAILHLAVSGQLVPRIKAEGTSEDLYEQVQAEKIKSATKKQKQLPEITEDETPFSIPSSWKWVHIGDVFQIRGGKRLPAGQKLSRIPSNHVYIRVTDMSNGTVDTTDLHYVDDKSAEEISRYIITSDDLYLSIAGSIGKVGKIPHELSGANLTENASRLTPYSNAIDLDFYLNVIASSFVQDQFHDKKVQMAQPKLALFRIENSLIPLPPLAEQKRIVAKTTKLLNLVTELEKNLEK